MRRATMAMSTALVLATLAGGLAEAKVVKLRFMMWGSNTGMEATVKLWNAQNPNIQVIYDGSTDWSVYFSKLPVMIAAGAPPDLFASLPESGRFEELSALGVMRDLTAYYKADGLGKDMFPEALEAATTNGRIYGVPFGISNNGFMAHNVDLFDQSGLTYPTRQWDLVDLTSAAKKLTKDIDGDGKPDIYGIEALGMEMGLILSAGGAAFNKEGNKLILGSPEAMRALQWVQDMYTKHLVVGGNFGGRKAAMYYSHPQGIIYTVSGAGPKLKSAIGWFPKDSVTGLRRWELDQNMICMAANTKHPKEAWQFLKWYISKDGLVVGCRDSFGTAQLVPSLKSVARSPGYLEPNRKKLPVTFNMQEIVDGMEQNSVPKAKTKLGYELRLMLRTNFTPVMKGTTSVQQYVAKCEREAVAIFARAARKK